MFQAFQKFIGEHKLIHSNDNTLLAISGGIDSIVMADLFLKLDIILVLLIAILICGQRNLMGIKILLKH